LTLSKSHRAERQTLNNGVCKDFLEMIRLRLLFYSLLTVLFVSVVLLAHVWAGNTEVTFDADSARRTPVLIELFTSEGCSDCPPADALLERLDQSQPVDGAELIVLSEHVDYWNGIGWKDPYSSHQYSERQNAYAGFFGLGSAYTPQMVVDGRFEFAGSDVGRATEAVEKATKTEKIAVHLSSAHLESDYVALHLDAGPLPRSSAAKSAVVWLAIADDKDVSHVSGGENGGGTLQHVAVVRTLSEIGTVDQSERFSQDLRLSVSHEKRSMRLIAFLQEQGTGNILGATRAPVANE
jgi:hypothetical protein